MFEIIGEWVPVLPLGEQEEANTEQILTVTEGQRKIQFLLHVTEKDSKLTLANEGQRLGSDS